MTKRDPFKYFHSSPEVIRLAVMPYLRIPLSLRNVADLLHERGIDISHETVRYCLNCFGPMFAAEIRSMRSLQKLTAVHASVSNHSNQERHLYSRDNFKANRTAALAEWRAFGAA
jgi:transposase-like protein